MHLNCRLRNVSHLFDLALNALMCPDVLALRDFINDARAATYP